jgi:hypothetical protein
VTQQYLVGEVSLLLAQLEVAAGDGSVSRTVAQLRREAESSPPAALGLLLARTFELTDCLCLDSLARGDVTAFLSQAATGERLRDFAVCARLLDELG